MGFEKLPGSLVPHFPSPTFQKMYLRHARRDGCVDVDLAIRLPLALRLLDVAFCLQMEAQNYPFAVWHQDQIMKRLPIKGWVGQEISLNDYLQYIQREALAAPRRSSARGSRKVRQPSLWSERV